MGGGNIEPADRDWSGGRVKFPRSGEFYGELRRRVDDYFKSSGLNPRDHRGMYLKSAIVLGFFLLSYLGLVFFATNWWQGILGAVCVGIAMAQIGFNIQHDGGHRAYSEMGWLNKLMAMTMDLVGGSSYNWYHKHVIFHHTYVNLEDHDSDIELGLLARMTPHQRRLPFHRFQQYYLWLLYGFILPKWHLYDDFRDVVKGRISQQSYPRPKGLDLLGFIGGKAVFLAVFFGVPLLFHPWQLVLAFYFVAVLVAGIIISVVFQLAHCVEESEFPALPEVSGQMVNTWAVHQVENTVDFARDSRLLSWLLGGLNFQIEHHLFPRISHVHYPEISKIVESTCREFGIRYMEHPTVWSGIASHYRWLREMGRPVPAAVCP